MRTFMRKAKKVLLSVIAIAPLAVAGCGTGVTDDLTEGAAGTSGEGEAVAVAIAGGGSELAGEASEEFASSAQADMNAAVAQVLSTKIEAAVNEELARMEAEEGVDASKDLRVGLGERGLTLFVDNEIIPFAGGTMALNGELGLKLRFPSFSEIQLVVGGGMMSTLDGVVRAGEVRGIPYELTLAGDSDMRMDGKFTMKIKSWKVSGMSANLTSAIVDSNVTATGMIADREAVGTVDMVNVSVKLANPDVLKNPGAFSAACTGTMATSVNGNVFASCDIDAACRGCK